MSHGYRMLAPFVPAVVAAILSQGARPGPTDEALVRRSTDGKWLPLRTTADCWECGSTAKSTLPST